MQVLGQLELRYANEIYPQSCHIIHPKNDKECIVICECITSIYCHHNKLRGREKSQNYTVYSKI